MLTLWLLLGLLSPVGGRVSRAIESLPPPTPELDCAVRKMAYRFATELLPER